jgi:hypothetical protein
VNLNRAQSIRSVAFGTFCAAILFAAASANAQVSWSIGINAPAPTYYEPAPIYYQPAPPVYYRQAPQAYYSPPPVYYGPPARGFYEREDHWRHERDHEHERGDHDRHHHRDRDEQD